MMMPESRILLISNPESLSVNFLLKLDFLKYRVVIFTENASGWKKVLKANNLSTKYIEITDAIKASEIFKYVVYVDSYLYFQSESDLVHRVTLYKTAARISKNNSSLSFYFFLNNKSRENNFPEIEKEINAISNTPKMFFLVTDMMGVNMPLNNLSVVSQVIRGITKDRAISITKDDTLVYPFDSAKLASLVLKLLEKKVEGKTVVSVRGDDVKLLSFAHALGEASKKDLPLYFDLESRDNTKIITKKEVIFKSSLSDLTKLIFYSPPKRTVKPKAIKLKITKPKVNLEIYKNVYKKSLVKLHAISKKLIKYFKTIIREIVLTCFYLVKVLLKGLKRLFWNKSFLKFALVIGGILLLVLSPFILISFSVLTMYFGVNAMDHGHFYRAKQAFKVSEMSSNVSSSYFGLIGKTNVGKMYVTNAISASVVINRFSSVGQKMAITSGTAFEFSKKILGNEPYRVSDYSEKIYLDLDSTKKELTHIAGEIDVIKKTNSLFVAEMIEKLDLKQKIEELGYLTEVIKNMPVLLGETNEKTYLLLFQNNMELRPTGGFIGSIGIVKFSKGRLIDINVMDVYSVDGQLKGHIEPPSPIRRHLNEANWYLRDSNWDPDFAVSGDRASWFLEKEIDIVPDAVIGVDLEALKGVISAFGELDMPDFNRRLNAKNFYDVVQYESERDFFPGSRAKSNFLMSLSKTSLLHIKDSKPDEQIRLTKSLVRKIQDKHVQVFFKEKKLQAIFDDLGWTGQNKIKTCLIENCLSDYLAINESNMGVNKANYFIQRSEEVELFFENGVINKKIKLTLANTANEVLDEKARYKAYVRVFAPLGTVFGPVSQITQDGEEVLGTDYQESNSFSELGFLVVVGAGKKVELNLQTTIYQNLNLNDPTQKYQFDLVKQAGLEDYPLKVIYNFPPNLIADFEKNLFTLTDNGSYVYNTVWSRDLSILTNWK